jgi:hypothetical protein
VERSFSHRIDTPLGVVVFSAAGFNDERMSTPFESRCSVTLSDVGSCKGWLVELSWTLLDTNQGVVLEARSSNLNGDIQSGERLLTSVFSGAAGWVAIGVRDEDWQNYKLKLASKAGSTSSVIFAPLENGFTITFPKSTTPSTYQCLFSLAFAGIEQPNGETEVWLEVDRLLPWD